MGRVGQIALESSNAVDSESELELSLSEFEDSDGNKSMEPVVCDVQSDFA